MEKDRRHRTGSFSPYIQSTYLCKLLHFNTGVFVVVNFFLLQVNHGFAQNWLQWGGPNGDFTVEAGDLADQWPAEGPIHLWKRPLGEGYSSILYMDGRLYTMYSEEKTEIVISLDAATGRTVWEHKYERELWEDMRIQFGNGPNASPIITGRRIITIGIAGHVRCLDLLSGKLIWARHLPSEFGRRERMEEYGYSGSPIRYEEMIILHVGGDDHAVIAIDPQDGSDIWRSAPGGVSYAQSSIIRIAGRDQYVYFSPDGINGLDPVDGRLLWHFVIPVDNGNHLTPVVQCDENHIFVSSQFDSGGGRLLRIKDENGRMEVKQLWFDSELQASCWTNVRFGDYIYGSAGGHNYSLLTAFEWRTGEVAWEQRGHRMAQCLLTGERLIYLDEKGKLLIAEFSPEALNILDKAQVASAISWTLPTLISTKLYIRDRKNIMALELGKK